MKSDLKKLDRGELNKFLPINLILNESSIIPPFKVNHYERYIVSNLHQTEFLNCEFPPKPISKILNVK